MNTKINNDNIAPQSPKAKIFVTIVSLFITLFYFISTMGWVGATYFLARTGQLGEGATKYYQSLTALDHVIRLAQVIVILIATGLLLFSKKSSLQLLLTNIFLSVIALIFVAKW